MTLDQFDGQVWVLGMTCTYANEFRRVIAAVDFTERLIGLMTANNDQDYEWVRCENVRDIQSPAIDGSRVLNPSRAVAIACMAPEARDLMDNIIDAYKEHYDAKMHSSSPEQVYQFTYWLCRYSGLVRPA